MRRKVTALLMIAIMALTARGAVAVRTTRKVAVCDAAFSSTRFANAIRDLG